MAEWEISMAGSWGSKRSLAGFGNSAPLLFRILVAPLGRQLCPFYRRGQLDLREAKAGGKLRSREAKVGEVSTWPGLEAQGNKLGVRETVDR